MTRAGVPPRFDILPSHARYRRIVATKRSPYGVRNSNRAAQHEFPNAESLRMLKNRFQTRKSENSRFFGFLPPAYLTLMQPELFSMITYGPRALHVPRYIPYQCSDKGILGSGYCSQRYHRLKGSDFPSIRAVDSGRQTAGRGTILLAFMETISTSQIINS